jgi:hypothetical protein
MRIAILISGRAARYDVCLLPLLNNNPQYDINIFMSINDENEDCEYYNIMKEKLKPWLKSCVIKKYIIPDEITKIFNPDESISTHGRQANLQKINNKYLPYNSLSMYYNDNNAFKNACFYAENNGFEYDYYMKYRSDIINQQLPQIIPNKDEILLYSAIPLCNFTSCGIFKKPIVCDAIAWGNKKTMSIYCNTYSYVLNKIYEYNGKYYVAHECSLTDNIYENNIHISYHNVPYSLDKDRRMFDDIIIDSRKPIPNQENFMKITDKNAILYIPCIKQE